MRRSRIGWLLVATAIFIVLATVPFAEGYRRKHSFIENVQSMTLRILPDKYKPSFQDIDFIPRDAVAVGRVSVKYGNSDKTLIFPEDLSQKEILKIIHAAEPDIQKSASKRLSFSEWTVSQKGVRLPFSIIFLASASLAFAGTVLIIFSRLG